MMWFKMPSFYICCIVYVGCRAFNNCFGVLLPFYLADVIELGDDASGISFNLALVPLIVYAGASLTSSKLSILYSLIGRKKALVIGTMFGLVGLLGMYVLSVEYSHLVYYFAVFVGISSGLVLSTGVNLITEVIGDKGKKGAFVYGFYGLIDKCVVGGSVYFVTHSGAYSNDGELTPDEVSYVRNTMISIPAISLIVATVAVLFFKVPEYKVVEKVDNDEPFSETEVS